MRRREGFVAEDRYGTLRDPVRCPFPTQDGLQVAPADLAARVPKALTDAGLSEAAFRVALADLLRASPADERPAVLRKVE